MALMAAWATLLIAMAGCMAESDLPGETQVPFVAERVEVMEYNGSTGIFACVPNGPSTCAIVLQQGDENTRYALTLPSLPNQVFIEISWSETSDLTRGLRFTLLAEKRECTRCFEEVATLKGPSPLTLTLENMTWPSNTEGLELVVVGVAQTPAHAIVHPNQPFRVQLQLAYSG